MVRSSTTSGDSNRSGRRRVRRDAEAVAAAFKEASAVSAEPAASEAPAGIKVIKLGPKEGSFMLDLIDEYQREGKPVFYRRRDEIAARHGKTPGAVVVVQLRRKGALLSPEAGLVKDKDCVPRIKDVVYVDGKGQQLWPPPEGEAKIKRRGARRERPAPQPAPVQVAQGEYAGAWVVPSDTPPVCMSQARASAYAALIAYVRAHGRSTHVGSSVLIEIIQGAAPALHSFSLLGTLEHEDGCLHLVSGKRSSHTSPPMRVVVFRPYFVLWQEVVVPPECHALAQSPPAQDTPPTPESPPRARTITLPSREALEEEIAGLQQQIDVKVVDARRDVAAQEKNQLADVMREEEELRKRLEALAARRAELEVQIQGADSQFDPSEVDGVGDLKTKRDRRQGILDNYDTLAALSDD